MTVIIGLNTALQHPNLLIDELSYSCYKYNREQSPDITPEQWATTLPNVGEMEKRFQEEKHDTR